MSAKCIKISGNDFKQLANSMGNFINIPYVICILIPMNSPDGHTTLKLDQVSSFA